MCGQHRTWPPPMMPQATPAPTTGTCARARKREAEAHAHARVNLRPHAHTPWCSHPHEHLCPWPTPCATAQPSPAQHITLLCRWRARWCEVAPPCEVRSGTKGQAHKRTCTNTQHARTHTHTEGCRTHTRRASASIPRWGPFTPLLRYPVLSKGGDRGPFDFRHTQQLPGEGS